MNGNGNIQLCKWWRTDSARRAFARVEQQRRERIERVRRQFEEKKSRLQQEVEQWEEK